MEKEQVKPWMKWLLKLFVHFYGLFGIQIAYQEHMEKNVPAAATPIKKRGWRSAVVIMRCLIATAYCVFVGGTVYSVARNVRGKPSLLDFVRFMYHITSFVIILYGGSMMTRHAGTLSQILFAPDSFGVRFYPTQFFVPLFMSFPSFVSDIEDAIKSFTHDRHPIQNMAHLCGLYLWAVQYATIGMYTECEAVIRGQLQEISSMVMTMMPNEDSVCRVTRAKCSVRASIEKINSIFGNILLVFYMKIFTLVTLRFGAVILWGTSDGFSPWRATINLLTAGLQIAQVFETTRLASSIISEAQRCEAVLYEPRKRSWIGTDTAQRCVIELRRVLKYRDNIDALTISDCFVNCKAAMFTYLGTMFTCIAIVLQFDFDVLKALDGAKQTAIE